VFAALDSADIRPIKVYSVQGMGDGGSDAVRCSSIPPHLGDRRLENFALPFARLALVLNDAPVSLLQRRLRVLSMTILGRICLVTLLTCLPFASFAQADAAFKKIQALDWKQSPSKGDISGKATINLDGGLRFLDAYNTNEFLTLQGNLPTTNTFAVTANDLRWFSVFSFVEEGLVQDNEKIDADGLLETLKENNLSAASERKKRGLPGLFLEGWFIPPRYDQETRRLEFATLLRTDSGEKAVNFSTKLLGRRGYMDVVLVSSPQSLETDIKEFKKALKGYDFVQGERYSEWKQGDKVAAYGLGALVLGGAAAVATKKGLWAILGGLIAAGWKVLAGLAVAALAGVGAIFKKKK
jgi:uncharacterized membrane-anchored protein